MESKNPKDIASTGKVPVHLWPEVATLYGAMGLLPGEQKYGRLNWRHDAILASSYFRAARSHLAAWFEGEDFDPEDGIPHLAHALATLAIIVDAMACNRFIDDRNYRGEGYREVVNNMMSDIGRVKALYTDRSPKHYSIRDGKDMY